LIERPTECDNDTEFDDLLIMDEEEELSEDSDA